MAHSSRKASCGCSLRTTETTHKFTSFEKGAPGTLDYRIHFHNQEAADVSPWHSIPLYSEKGMVNMVCEIPRHTRAKFEVATAEFTNPIKQDEKKGKPRFYGVDMKWNYGMFPQTWEDPSHASEDCGGFVGDNDPVDVVEIGNHDPKTGHVYAVKPVAALAMIDEGELDWKVVAISSADPRCDLVNDATDMETHFPGELNKIREWFRTYKTYEGKSENKFELNEAFVGRDYTMDVLSQTHGFWKSLIMKSRQPGASLKVVVGDVPVYTGCLEPEEDDTSSNEDIIETINSILEAVNVQEGEVSHMPEHLTMASPMTEGIVVS